MKTYSATRSGENKPVNQDCFLCEEGAVGRFENLFIVADGMGGYNGGEIASRFCVNNVKQYIESAREEDTIIATMREAITNTNDLLREKVAGNMELLHCGTTVVLATLCGHTLYVANIGDSRLYVLSSGEIRQITEDHSLVEEMVKKGHIAREKARFHPDKNIITRAIGSEPNIEADFFEVNIKSGDRILLCSDGVSNMMEERLIQEILNMDRDLSEIGNLLVDTAISNGGKDDITLVIVEV